MPGTRVDCSGSEKWTGDTAYTPPSRFSDRSLTAKTRTAAHAGSTPDQHPDDPTGGKPTSSFHQLGRFGLADHLIVPCSHRHEQRYRRRETALRSFLDA